LGSPPAANGAGAAGDTANGVLRVSGAVDDPEACRAALRRWLARTAGGRLSALLALVAGEEQLSFSAVSVRGQRSRWGSCSRRGVISLNRHLLFLPPELVRYVLLHELCHTLRPDHSPAFWREVRRREPGVERLRKELRAAGRIVPGWARVPRG
ncbi:MAG: M48 family metallopeptidase, partial [Thermoleophilia bacterium]